ncbi:MAG: hypothetical protein Q4Q23_02055 [Methanobacteriaceae archaeon]|nr:hypothetical protein [Methanobacteriaceae archaeon]
MLFNNENLYELDAIPVVGLDGTLFLNNDGNNELKQHFCKDYENSFNEINFRLSYNSKKEYCEKRGIVYKFYVIPDKSVICKNLLPVTPAILKRNVDKIKDLTLDFKDLLDSKDYLKLDSHLNQEGALKISAEIMHDIKPEVTSEMYYKSLLENLIVMKRLCEGDIAKNLKSEETIEELITEYKYLFTEILPIKEEFKKVKKRKSHNFYNLDSFTDLKVLVLRDSTYLRFMNMFNMFFRHVFTYWDHWMFNKKLIEWYKPDLLIEIRTERFLEKMTYELV